MMLDTIPEIDNNVVVLEPEDIPKTELQKKVTNYFNLRKPEDEVVAIILSAIIGSIIERWEPLDKTQNGMKPPYRVASVEDSAVGYSNNEDGSDFCDFQSQNNSILSEQINADEMPSFFHRSRTTNRSGTLEHHNVSLHHDDQQTEKTVDHPSETKQITSETFNVSSPVKPVDEEIEEENNVVLKSFFVNLKEKIFGWEILETDTEVVMVFKQGNSYRGKLMNCRMHGQGKFYWADGSIYEGDFFNGEMSGEGYLQWPDLSWYEGQMRQGYRHGLGLFVQSTGFYTGSWQCGSRHGPGAMYYNRNNSGRDYYNGEWARDYKSGTGLRCYPSGAKYSGQWRAGVRHGLGTMVWTNNDVYSGNWENNQIHGYGEYTWETFFNEQLVVPQENCYYGNWVKGVRHGNGTLETSLGVTVRGTWDNGKKHGPAEVICSNGSFVYSDNLFKHDCIYSVTDMETDSLMDASMHSLNINKVPVSAPNHDINLSFYSERLKDYITECKRTGKICGIPKTKCGTTIKGTLHTKAVDSRKSTPLRTFTYNEEKMEAELEEILLRNVVLQYLSAMKVIYVKYSELCCQTKPTFQTVLMRLMFWQLLRDCDLYSRGLSLADFDILIANNKASLVQAVHYPFERLQFWQFLHCLIEISWELYSRRGDGTPTIQGRLAAGLHKLFTVDILPKAGRHRGHALFKQINLLSLDALYWYYKGLGEPLSARKLLKSVFTPSDENRSKKEVPDYPIHLLHGKNVIGVGGRLTYCPGDEPMLPDVQPADNSHPQDLTCLRGIGLLSMFQCLLEVCPSIAADGIIINIDYKIVFFEFYHLLLLCARSVVKKKKMENKESEVGIPMEDISKEPTQIDEEVKLDEETKVSETEVKSKKLSKSKKKKK